VRNARQTFEQGTSLAQRLGLKEFAAGLRVSEAACDAEVGDEAAARKGAAEAIAISDDRDTRIGVATVLALTGDAIGSEKHSRTGQGISQRHHAKLGLPSRCTWD
jgi:hypothetical protein